VTPQQQQSSAPASGDLLGSLLGGLMGAPQQQQQPASQGTADLLGALLGGTRQSTGAASNADPMGDMLGSLLGGLTGTGTSSSAQSGKIDIGKLLKAGMAYMSAKQIRSFRYGSHPAGCDGWKPGRKPGLPRAIRYARSQQHPTSACANVKIT